MLSEVSQRELLDTENRLVFARAWDGVGERHQKVQTSRYKANKFQDGMHSLVALVTNPVLHI